MVINTCMNVCMYICLVYIILVVLVPMTKENSGTEGQPDRLCMLKLCVRAAIGFSSGTNKIIYHVYDGKLYSTKK